MATKRLPKTTPTISKREYIRRRASLMTQMEPDSIAIVPSATTLVRNRDAEFKFRQDSDFYYLTGFNEPESVLVLVPGREHGECIVFCRERDPERELWDGYRQGPEGVCKNFAVDDAFPITDIDEILPGLLEGRERVYYSMGKRPEFDKKVMDWINVLRSNARSGAHPPGEFLDLDHLLHDMRLYKSAAELRIMQAAADISAAAHQRAMQLCKPGLMEYELEAEYLHEFTAAGAQSVAYSSIVGAGKNACILHYIENNAVIQNGDLVLVDAGCELNCYASDITRTFPANGKFSKEQAALYDIVLESQLQAIKSIKPGSHWDQPHNETVSVITQGLKDLGLLKGDVAELIETEAYRDFYMHRAGHWLGMDVHDVGNYKVHDQWRVLEPGMVITVEPGVYVSPNNKQVAAKWRGIGIRIEDDVVVTKKGHHVLTGALVKTRADIESLMKGSLAKVKSTAKPKPTAKAKAAKKLTKGGAKTAKVSVKAASAKAKKNKPVKVPIKKTQKLKKSRVKAKK